MATARSGSYRALYLEEGRMLGEFTLPDGSLLYANSTKMARMLLYGYMLAGRLPLAEAESLIEAAVVSRLPPSCDHQWGDGDLLSRMTRFNEMPPDMRQVFPEFIACRMSTS